jgi:nucleotide-binding universal stress UspA family protein
MVSIKRIMVPIDWSKSSMGAFEFAGSLARDHNAKLVLLYVVPVPVVMYGPPPEKYLQHLEEQLARVQPSDPKTQIEHRLCEGNPARVILREAQDSKCDLIVMGTHGRTGGKRLLMGSVAEEVVRRAACPVITVKAGTTSFNRPLSRIGGG